jgi:hypothetical protein
MITRMPTVSRTLVAAVSGLALAGLSQQVPPAVGSAASATGHPARATAGPHYRATIRTTAHRIPHNTSFCVGRQ